MTELVSATLASRAAELATVELETPAFVYDEAVLAAEARAIRAALEPTSARLLLAMKAFSFEHGLRVLAPFLDGLHASSPFEARLARRVMAGGIVHTTTPGLRDRDVPVVASASDLLSFNSLAQWRRHRATVHGLTSPGIRINPGLSFVEDEHYDPCARNSKLGVPLEEMTAVLDREPRALEGVEGILVHSNAESTELWQLRRTVMRLVGRLDPLLRHLQWVNLGGGYLFQDATDTGPLHEAVTVLQDRYGVEVLVEPGTALVQRAGSLVATVVDLVEGQGRDIAVLDTTANHLPEVLEYRYAPEVANEDGCHSYLLAGASCLVSDHFGVHCFSEPLRVGARVVIVGAGSYSLVKASWFNGIGLPTVYSRSPDGSLHLRHRATFADFIHFHGGDDHADPRA